MTGRRPADGALRRRLRLGDAIDEKAWQDDVADTAARLGWHRRYHTFDSRHSAAGFPDLVLVRRPRIIFAELKSEAGRVTREQLEWLDELEGCVAETYLWRPSDRFTMDRVLAGKGRP